MNKVKVIIEGFAKVFDDHEEVSPSVVLIENDQHKIIVDPGFNKEALLQALAHEGLTTGQIDIVFLTHTHLDHCVLAGIFENARVMDNSDQYQLNGIISRQPDNCLGDGIEVIQTPGHDQFHSSLAVKTADMGTVVVAGDIFWWVDGEEPLKDYESLISFEDPYVKDLAALIESRKKVLAIADYVIPGHGKMFKNER